MKIPQYQMSGSPTSEAPNVRIDAESTGQAGRNMQTMGNAVADVAFKVKQAYDDERALKAQETMSQGIVAIKTKMASDPNLMQNRETYFAEIAKVRDGALKGVGNPRHATALSSKFETDIENFDYDFTSMARPQQIKRAKAQFVVTNEALNNEWLIANDARKIQIWNEKQAGIRGLGEKGYMDPEEVELAIIAERDALTQREIDDKQNKAVLGGRLAVDQFIAGLDDETILGKKLDAKTINHYTKSSLEMLGNMTKRADAEAKEVNRVTRISYLEDLASGKVDFNPQAMTDLSASDPELAAAVQSVSKYPVGQYAYSSESNALEQKAYFDVAKQMFDKKDNEQLNKFLISSLKQNTPGVGPGVKLGILLTIARQQGMANNPKTDKDMQARTWTSSVKSAMQYLIKSNASLAPSMGNDLLERIFLKKLTTPEQIRKEAAAVTVENTRAAYPEINHLPAVPNMILDSDGELDTIYEGENQLQGDEYVGDKNATSSQERAD